MTEIKVCDLKDIIHFSEKNCYFSSLNRWYGIYLDGILIGAFGYIFTRVLDIDRILGLTLVIDEKYRNKGLCDIVGRQMSEKLIYNSINGKIWILTKMLNKTTEFFAKRFGFIDLNKDGYYLYHNTKEDSQSELLAYKTIDILNKTKGIYHYG